VTKIEGRLALALGCGLVLLVNAIVLAVAWWNRTGEPSATLELTERELALPAFRSKDDSGLVLSIVSADRPPSSVAQSARLRTADLPDFELPWLDAAKLASLGIPAARDDAQGVAARRVFLVLENDGEAWRAWLADRERSVRALREGPAPGSEGGTQLAEAEALLEIDRTSRSRLVPVDAGLEPGPLRDRYPDRSRYAVVPGAVEIVPAPLGRGTRALRARIAGLEVDRVHVPLGLLARLDRFVPRESAEDAFRRARESAAKGWPAPAPPRFRATVRFGRGYRPWLVEVTPIDAAAGK